MIEEKKNLAAIDIGTNSFHVVIAEINVTTGRFRILVKDKEIVRLGSGSTDMKYISEAAMNRGIAALKRFQATAETYSAEIRAIATSAVREALNRDEFLRRVKSETGIKIEIASGVEEARLIHMGVLQALSVFNKRIMLVDIGGGSTEFLIGKKRDVLFSNSLKLGAVRLTERFFNSEKLDKKAVDECRMFVKGTLSPVTREINNRRFDVCIGSSGTIIALASIIRSMRGDDPNAQMNNVIIKRDELLKAVEYLLKVSTVKNRAELTGMDPLRADIMVAGAIILEQIFIEMGLSAMTISEYALREGIVFDTIEKQHLEEKTDHLDDLRYNSVIHLAENFHYEKNHSHKVAQLALQLFDQTTSLHKCGIMEREYLEAAALLHDIGLYVSHSQHHRHTYYIVRNSDLPGFTEAEKEIIANIARYHRKSHPKIKHEGFVMLSDDEKQIVSKMSAILRIADGLDRSHAALVTGVKALVQSKSVLIQVNHQRDAFPEMEMWGAERKKDLFSLVFNKNVTFIAAC